MAFVSFRVVVFLSAGFLAGCGSVPAPTRLPDPSVPSEPERIPTAPVPKSAATFTYRDGRYVYDFLQTTTVSVGAETGALAEDTLRTMGGLTYSVSGSPGTPVVSISVDSLLISSVRDTAMPARRLAAPVVVQLPLPALSITTPADSAAFLSTCDALEDAARAVASDVHVEIPVVVQRGQSWSDSTSFVLCRGGIPLTGTRVSRFQITDVREARDSILAKVARQTTLTIAGAGTQGNRVVTVRGEGTSDAVFSYDLTGGRFLEGTGQSVLRLSFETTQQTDQIIQRGRSSIRLRSATPNR